ncbi:MAG: IS3 family transposase [Proteobacteria bacterium]|nr:MAG: IS3 family transposase [Pseudomonadota bacterium]
MGRESSYSKEFRDSIVSKIVNRRNQSVSEVCEAEGINQYTAANWLRSATMPAMKKKNRSRKWTAKQKLKAISETLTATETEVGTYLRKEGLHSHELSEWQEQALASLESSSKAQPSREEFNKLQEELKRLEREVLRKDKALAEASALLILQKKIGTDLGRRGSKVKLTDRKNIIDLIDECGSYGASRELACKEIGVSLRTVQRWASNPEQEDRRSGPNSRPANSLTEAEKSSILSISTTKEFQDKSPHQIVPILADRGQYIASESSFYRVLRANSLLSHRGKSRPRSIAKPRPHEATGPRQLFSWDITYLKSDVKGKYYFLYMFLDVFSRKKVGWAVHDRESPDHSSALLERICQRENIGSNQLNVHSDNGGPMKGATMLATMQKLGVVPSFSRPSVKDDNPFSEALFKTVKYVPAYPSQPFSSEKAASSWVRSYEKWYNEEHLHSAISFTTPSSRHSGADEAILLQRKKIYDMARENKPERWSGETRNWEKKNEVYLNWLKEDEGSAKQIKLQSVI